VKGERFVAPKVSENYKEEKKKALLNFARTVFAEKGYLKTSMQDIMDEANISRGALYSYFKNINEIFIEVLKIDDSKCLSTFEFNKEKSIWDQLNRWIEKNLKDILNAEGTMTRAKSEFFILVNYKNLNENFGYIKERHITLEKKIEEIIKSGVERGEFNPKVSLNSIAIYFISFIDSLMLNNFNLGISEDKLNEQIIIFKYSLEDILCLNKKI